MTAKDPMSFEPGDAWCYVSARGESRRYEVDHTVAGPPGVAVFLNCLDPPLPSVDGYRGGVKRQAMMLAHSGMQRRPAPGVAGWLPGHGD